MNEVETKEVAISATNERSLNVLNLFDEKELAKAEVFLKKIMLSNKCSVKTTTDGLAILLRAQELNLPFSFCADHMYDIAGKYTPDVHIAKSLLSRAGVIWECTRDYAPLYKYTDGNLIYNSDNIPSYCTLCKDAKQAEALTNGIGVYPLTYYKDTNGNVFTEFEVSDKAIVAKNHIHAAQLKQDGKYAIYKVQNPIDYVTEYKFTRYRIINGVERITTSTGKFSRNDAIVAELDRKDNWKKYFRVMLQHRAFMLGAREIADDLLQGIYITTEVKQNYNQPLTDIDCVEV